MIVSLSCQGWCGLGSWLVFRTGGARPAVRVPSVDIRKRFDEMVRLRNPSEPPEDGYLLTWACRVSLH